jgi:membrane protease YdiL (CAAX protease family)
MKGKSMMQNTLARICLVWVALLAVFLGKTQLATLLFGPDYALDRHVFMAVLTTALVVPLVVLARHHLDRQPFADLGLALDLSRLKPLLVGALAWFGPFLVGLGICLGFGLVRIEATVSWSEILAFVPLLIVLVFLLEALPEELAFRGYLQTNLGKLLQPWLAVIVQALLFGSWGVALWLITSGGLDPLHASLFYVMGAVLGMVRLISGSVWTGIGFHLAFQTAAQLLMNAERGHFQIEGMFWLQVLALGAIPFSLAIPIVERFYRDRVAWGARPA